MSFQTGLSGLNASARNLDVIGHNIANANTTGMKASRAEFAEVYASSLGATGGANYGIGVQVATVAQLFTQGNLKITGNQLDLAINGSGFFQVRSTDGSVLYTRNGEFKLDRDGYIITNNGSRLQGFPTNESGVRTSVVPQDLVLPTGSVIDPRRTGGNPDPALQGMFLTANLDARSEPQVVAPAVSASFPLSEGQKTYGTATNVYDSQGVPIPVQLYFIKLPAANEWQVVASADNGVSGQNLGTITFDAAGRVASFLGSDGTTPALDEITVEAGTGAANVVYTGNAQSPSDGTLTFPLRLGDATAGYTLTQFGSKFGVFDLRQDGYASGELTSIDIGENGVILARYSNGVSIAEGQVALGNFRNLQGLQPINGGYWSETIASGPVVLGGPLEGRLGLVRQSSLEESNVDLTQELVNMIVAQRAYQANAQTIKTQDQVQQTLVNLR
ncbi:flagellar hook protein FlgE [Tepidicella xavieri]|jgi:flagellar hook protein FlgE|uniref:Flagellar hook protein FlgE n=1 Tax=Tepidicella xavieri TaxID=360241 RepID=A0A4R6U3K5_9BURK|nr:flagellar hook protein FlgE [Tepidicella xavieri]TDQ40601.1 flagellar hook protein FlgE [Tepidicella xavieri]